MRITIENIFHLLEYKNKNKMGKIHLNKRFFDKKKIKIAAHGDNFRVS